MDHRLISLLLVLLLASAEPILVKAGYREGISTLQLLFLRNIFACLTICAVTRTWKMPNRSEMSLVLPLAILLFATNGLTLFALRSMDAALVIMVVTTTPLFVALVNQWRRKEILDLRFWAGFALCFIGVLLSVNTLDVTKFVYSGGILAAFLAVISSTIYRTRMETAVSFLEPQHISRYIFYINGLLSIIGAALFWEPITPLILPIAASTGAFAALANFVFIGAIQLLGATRMSIFDLLQRPIVVIAAVVLLNERLTLLQGVGLIAVMVGVPLARVKKRIT